MAKRRTLKKTGEIGIGHNSDHRVRVTSHTNRSLSLEGEGLGEGDHPGMHTPSPNLSPSGVYRPESRVTSVRGHG